MASAIRTGLRGVLGLNAKIPQGLKPAFLLTGSGTAGSRALPKPYETGLRGKSRGFTLIELMIVISMIMILIAIAIPSYNQSITRAREGVLKQNLFTLRSLLSQYTLDKQKAPESLDDLVSGGYMKQIPNDPMTGKPDWTVEQEEETLMSVDETEGGIDDVHSASSQTGTDGTAYSTW